MTDCDALIIFIGAELATEFSGYVEGALRSARSAATRVLAATGEMPWAIRPADLR